MLSENSKEMVENAKIARWQQHHIALVNALQGDMLDAAQHILAIRALAEYDHSGELTPDVEVTMHAIAAACNRAFISLDLIQFVPEEELENLP